MIEGIVDLAHEDEIVETGAALALKKCREQTGGRAPMPSDEQKARKKWEAAGKPEEGIRFEGAMYIFKLVVLMSAWRLLPTTRLLA